MNRRNFVKNVTVSIGALVAGIPVLSKAKAGLGESFYAPYIPVAKYADNFNLTEILGDKNLDIIAFFNEGDIDSQTFFNVVDFFVADNRLTIQTETGVGHGDIFTIDLDDVKHFGSFVTPTDKSITGSIKSQLIGGELSKVTNRVVMTGHQQRVFVKA